MTKLVLSRAIFVERLGLEHSIGPVVKTIVFGQNTLHVPFRQSFVLKLVVMITSKRDSTLS